MITKGTLYKLNNDYLVCTKLRKNGMSIFQVSDSNGNILPPIRAKNGFITDHGTRLVFRRINELIEVT